MTLKWRATASRCGIYYVALYRDPSSGEEMWYAFAGRYRLGAAATQDEAKALCEAYERNNKHGR